MHIVIGGYGRTGKCLAHAFEAQGRSVAIIDRDPAAFEEFDEVRGLKLTGEVFDRETMTRAGIEKADCYCAVTSGDNSNFVSSRIAKEVFNVPLVLARIYEPRRAEIYRGVGIRTISSVEWACAQFQAMVDNPESHSAFQYGTGEVEMLAVHAPKTLYGKRLAEFELPGEIRVAAVVRGGSAILPAPGLVIAPDDRLYVNVSRASAGKFRALLDAQ